MEMGYGMAGIEDRISSYAEKITQRFDEITYVEIGVGEGATLSAISLSLKVSGKKWRSVGIELPNGYSFNREKTVNFAIDRGVGINFATPNGSIVHPAWDAITVYFKDSQSFLTEFWQDGIQFALIDGCHGKPCVILDFLAIEAFMTVGGIVMFHDFDEEQRGHFQPHCPTGLDVMGACSDLGLLSNKRKGWRFIEKFNADRVRGGWDMGVFQKIEVAGETINGELDNA